MKVTVQQLPKSEVKLTIEVPQERLEKFMLKAAEQISMHFKIPGFRAGHVPLEVLKQHVNEEGIEAQMLDIALPETYTEAVMKEKLQVVSRPKIDIKSKNPLVYEATVAVYPKVEVSGYDKVSISKEEPKVDDKDVEKVLEDISKRRATYKDVEREAQKGDRVEIDFAGFDEGGAPLENTNSKNHPLILGENSLIPGFEDEIIGLKKGADKQFKITFPKEYHHKPFQNKKVDFKVTVNRVEEGKFPEWTPEFIKEVTGEEQTLDQVKEMIKTNLAEDKKQAEKVRRENAFLDKIIEHTKVETPEILIDEEIDMMIGEFKDELETQLGVTVEQFLEQNKKEMKDLRAERRKEAEKRLTLRFGLQKLFEQEKIDVTKAELDHEMEHIIGLYPANEQYKVRKEYKEGSYLLRRLENKMKMDKLFAKFLG
jgi:trigger factor